MDYISLIVFIIYFILLLLIGYGAYKKNNDFSDYILGGRSLGPWIGGISTGASDMSGWLLLALPGAVYATGISGGIWLAIGLAVGAFLNWRYVGDRVRKLTIINNDSETLPEFLTNRTKDTTKSIKIISAVFILIFFTFYVSSGLVSGALLFQQTFHIPYHFGLLLIGLVILTYTMSGGFFAVTWTDFVQGIIMLVALVAVPVVTIFYLGGWFDTVSSVKDLSQNKIDAFQGISTLGIISALAWGLLGYFGQPHSIVRFMSIRSSKDLTIGRAIYTSWNVIAMYGGILVGFTAIAFFAEQKLKNPEMAFIQLTHQLFPSAIASILLVALLAAVMSTVSSQLLVSSTAIAEDLYKGLIHTNASDRLLFWIIRGSIVLITTLAFIIGFSPQSSILDLVSYAWAGFAASFGPPVLFSVFWNGTTRNGVLGGIITGGITIILWSSFTKSGFIPFELYEIVPGFIFSCIAVYTFSKLGPKPTVEMKQEFELINDKSI